MLSTSQVNVRDRSQAVSPYRKEWNNYLFGKDTPVYVTLNITAPTGTSIRINGVDGGSGSESGTNFESSITGWNLGKMENNNIGFDGDIWEIIIYDGNVTGDDRTTIETYIKDKYALSLTSKQTILSLLYIPMDFSIFQPSSFSFSSSNIFCSDFSTKLFPS